MSERIVIKNFKKIRNADLPVGKITFLCGKGMAGKTSSLGAIAALSTMDPVPFKGLTKKDVTKLINKNSPNGAIEYIAGDMTVAKVLWPDGKCLSYDGATRQIMGSTMSTGLSNIFDMKDKDRKGYLISLLDAVPTDQQLMAEMKDVGCFTKEAFDNLKKQLEVNGWDITEKKIKESITKLKGAWEQVTGLNYGSKIAENYEPENFDRSIVALDRAGLESTIKTLNQQLTEAMETEVIDKAKVDDLKVKVGLTPALKAEIETLALAIDSTKKEIAITEATIKKHEVRGLECPHCKTRLTLSNGKLLKIPQDEVCKPEEAEMHIKKKQSLENQKNVLLEKMASVKAKMSDAAQAQEALDAIAKTEAASHTGMSKDKYSELVSKLEKANRDMSDFDKYHKAKEIYHKIVKNSTVTAILAPTGLRATILKGKLATLNNSLKILTEVAGWETVSFDDNGDIFVDGDLYNEWLLSRSQIFRVKTIVRIILSIADKSNTVILDDVDILMKTERKKLLKVLMHKSLSNLRIFAAIAYDDKSEMPDFSKLPGCTAVWIEDGMTL